MLKEVKGLFINNKRAQDSIYESGVMVFECLKLSDKFTLDYIEISLEQREIPTGYDFYFFNYHPFTMPWLETSSLKKLDGSVITMILEVAPGDPFVLCPRYHFDYYCVLDPSLKTSRKNVFPFPRPLERANVRPYKENAIPVIGSFGFATRGKGFQHVVEAVNKEFDQAIIKINIPFGSFVPDSEEYSHFLEKVCRGKAKNGIEVLVTHDYMTKIELIDWCATNTLNCFLYDRNMPGLAATTDQAIVSGRPLAVSDNDTFRHILSYLQPYPEWSLKESIQKSTAIVLQMQQEWSPERFCAKFEEITDILPERKGSKILKTMYFTLPEKRNTIQSKLRRIFSKATKMMSVKKLIKIFSTKSRLRHEELI